MPTWKEDTIQALANLGGQAPLSEIYAEIRRVRPGPYPKSLAAIVRKELEYNSSHSSNWKGNEDLFYSVDGIGHGIWGLRALEKDTPIAIDLGAVEETERAATTTYRILRDTALARRIKTLHDNKCQLCGEAINLGTARQYSEAHHIQPLGAPHNGPDIAENILVLCPNHHVLCDYSAIELRRNDLRTVAGHEIGDAYIEFHNRLFKLQQRNK